MPPRASVRWLAWLVGAAILASVILVATRFAEEREIVRLLAEARPVWLLWAVLLQASTYVVQAEVWRMAARRAGARVPFGQACELSLAKLFADQALPSAGISGSVLVVRALEHGGLPRGVAMAAVVVDAVSYYAAYAVAVAAALCVAALRGPLQPLLVGAALVFIPVAAALALAVAGVFSSGRAEPPALLGRSGWVRAALELLQQAEPRLVRSPALLARAGLLQLAIVALDALTLFVLVRALGAAASPGGVFVSFVAAALFRTIGLVPGGLGTFEAASVAALRWAGTPLSAALSATLLFRGLSFWLPMLPGVLVSRRIAAARAAPPATIEAYWALEPGELLERLGSSAQGLAEAEARARLERSGSGELVSARPVSLARVLWNQLASPLLAILVFAAAASLLSGEWVDAAIVLVILATSVGIGASREYRAQSAAAALTRRVRTQTRALRGGQPVLLLPAELVPGDVVLLSAGSLVPADGVLVEASDFFVNEAVLTGESFPAEKKPGRAAPRAALAERRNCVFQGTNVRTGSARAVVVATGASTEFGEIAQRLVLRPPETEFDRGVRQFGALLTRVMFVMLLLVFAANTMLGRPPIETLLFSVALAVGLSPELLPAILSVNLARGAQAMARRGVLVRRLAAIENLGSMDVLCTDKTGTLTEGIVKLEGAYDAAGARSEAVLQLAALNSALQTGFANPLDEAILHACSPELGGVEKRGEVPYDFVRKRLSVVVREAGGVRLIAKGAFERMLEACTRGPGGAPLDAARRAQLLEQFRAFSAQGIRVVAVATRALPDREAYGRDDERELEFAGCLTFLDQPKEGVREAVRELAELGVALKLITGDARLVAEHVARAVGLPATRVIRGRELQELHDEALWKVAEQTDLFVEVDPNQKERIILALKKTGHVVGFLGDGVNDAAAMHAADTSLSVEGAVDVAREAADFVLLEKQLGVIRSGIEEGRRTFANTLKYILITTSANFGNMLSMAAASLFLPFLPLLAGQVLLNNFLSDIPAIGIADDLVDPEMVAVPRRWDMKFLSRFMINFGALSSLFDGLTFGVLLAVFAAGPELFRTGWFVESLLTELAVALVMRTRRPVLRSRPGRLLLVSTLALVPLALAIPYLPRADWLGFVPLPVPMLAAICGLTALYVLAAERAKARFYRRFA